MVPLSVLGQVRRELIARLDAAATARPHRRIAEQGVVARRRESRRPASETESPRAALRVLCRSIQQLEAALQLPIDELYADFHDIREYGRAAKLAQQFHKPLLLAPPRIQKPREMGIFRVLLRHPVTGILARNLSGLDFFHRHGRRVVADFSLNAANEITIDVLRELGAERVTASYDLNRDQLAALVASTDPGRLEIVVHQHMPMFHMEHCVFCAVLSPGTNKTNCGRPCDRHRVQLRDRLGMDHPLHADVGCRNTLFNAVPQSAAEAIPSLLGAGIRHFRIELLEESPGELRRIVQLYRRLLDGRIAARDVWQQLQASNRVGVTRGTLEERRNPLAIL